MSVVTDPMIAAEWAICNTLRAHLTFLRSTAAVVGYQPRRDASQIIIWADGETGYNPGIWDRHMRKRLFLSIRPGSSIGSDHRAKRGF